VQTEGSTEWKPLSALPEFAEALAAKSVGEPPPKVDQVNADVLTAEILARDYQLDIGGCFRRGWELLKENFWLAVGATALVLVIDVGIESIPFVGWIVGTVLGLVLFGGLDWFFLKLVRGQPTGIGDAFAGFSMAFVPLLLGGIVMQVLIGIGLLLCILPGIYLAVSWYFFTALLILDKKLDFWPAMELSRRVVTMHWWKFFGLFLLCFLLFVAGVLACGVGVFIALPWVWAACVYAYEDIFGSAQVKAT
jgi:hypothetical protein